MTPTFFTTTTERVILMMPREPLALESKPGTSVGEQALWIWITMVFQTFSWLPDMSTRRWNELCRNIRTKHHAPSFGIWAAASLKNLSRRPARVWRRPTVAEDALLETSTTTGM